MKFLSLLCLLTLISVNMLAQPKQLIARSYYNFDSTLFVRLREIPSDSAYYTYVSGIRKGDWEKGIQYDTQVDWIVDIHNTKPPTPRGKSMRYYDARTNVLADTAYLWDNTEQKWLPSALTIYTYDTKNHVLSELAQLWDGSDYRNYTRVSTSYTTFDSVERRTYENYTNNAWTHNWRYTYSYDTKHRPIRNDAEEGYTTGNWQPAYTETWEYDSRDNVIHEESTTGGSLKVIRRYYDTENYLIAQTYDETGIVIRRDSTSYIYSSNHQALTIMVRTEIVGHSVSSYKSAEQLFDSQKHLISNISYQVDKGIDVPMSEQHYSYDNKGRKTTDSLFSYTAGKRVLDNVYTYGYNDAFNTLQREGFYSAKASGGALRLYSLTTTERTETGQLAKVQHERIIDTLDTWNITGVTRYYYGATTDVPEPEATAGLLLYPNPATQSIYVESSDNANILTIHLYDAAGKHIDNIRADVLGTTLRVETSRLPAGAYTLRVLTSYGTRSLRFVKE